MKKAMKTILALCVALTAMFAISMLASAQTKTVNGTATFDGSNVKLVLSKGQLDEINNLQPGDDIKMTFDMVNNSSEQTDWYVQESVIKAFEDDSIAKNGAFAFNLSYKYPSGKTLDIMSKVVGGEVKTGPVGLHQATQGTEKLYFLDTLKPKEKGILTIQVSVEGETNDKTYMNALSTIKVNFAVEINKNATKKVYNSGKSSSSKGLLTGDRGRFVIYLALLIVSLAVLFTVLGLQTRSRRKK